MNIASLVTVTVVNRLTRPPSLPRLFLQGQHERFDFAVHHEHDARAFRIYEGERLTEKLGQVRLEFVGRLEGANGAQGLPFKWLAPTAEVCSRPSRTSVRHKASESASRGRRYCDLVGRAGLEPATKGL